MTVLSQNTPLHGEQPQYFTCQQPLTAEQQDEYDRIASAVMVIPLGARSRDGQHDASKVIGYALSNKYGTTNIVRGFNLAVDWDGKTGGHAVGVYSVANPNHPNPVTISSIFDVAKSIGWTHTSENCDLYDSKMQFCASSFRKIRFRHV